MSTLGWPGTWGAVAALMLAGCGGATSGPGPADTSDGADSADLVAEDAGSDAGPDLAPDPLHDPSLPGPFEVGVTTVTWYDADRDRSLLVDIWYPAIPEAGAAPHAYPLALAEDVVLGELPSGLGVVEDAAADLSGAPYPVVLFSHGNNGMRFQNLFQGEHLASHGYVFVAPDHTGNLVIDSVLGQVRRVFYAWKW